jgi:hypothetical protein
MNIGLPAILMAAFAASTAHLFLLAFMSVHPRFSFTLKFRTPLERVIGSQQFEIVTFFWNGGS